MGAACMKAPAPPETEEYGSDHANTVIDNRTDEQKIEANPKGYPKPKPPDHQRGKNFQQKYYWFKNDDFNFASDDVDLFTAETAVDEEDFDIASDEIIEAPNFAPKPVVSYDDVDAHSRKAGKSLLGSFDGLIDYLTENIRNDKYRKMKTARAIVVWMSMQDIEKEKFGKKSLDTPQGLMQYLKEEKMTYTTCYTLLCRKAGLQCVVIQGHTKAASYEPGDKDVVSQTWCAVNVECGWQIVMPFWVCRALYGHRLGGWVKIEADGKTMRQPETGASGVVMNTFRDMYFMPEPEEFIYKCCASDSEWQLVRPEKVVPSLEHFLEMPYLFTPFFGVGLTLLSEQKCVLHSQEGFCKIELQTTPGKSALLVLQYELFEQESEDDENTDYRIVKEMPRTVFNSRASETFTFDVRFPKRGIFKLVIYGGPYKSSGLRLCEFKLVCEHEMQGRNLLPLDCSKIGWGPGPVATEAGLLMPSKHNGLVPVSEKERKTEIKFQLETMDKTFKAAVHGEVDGRRQTLSDDAVEIQKNKRLRQLVISVSIPGKGEYGVTIAHVTSKLTAKSRRESAEVVCAYLLSSYAFKPEHANVYNAKKKLRESVSSASEVEPRYWKQHIQDIEQNIDLCKKQRIPDSEDELLAARDTVGLLQCKDKLRDCELRRNLRVIGKTLHLVSRYRNKAAVTREIDRVKNVERELVALHGFARQVPKLEDAHKELVALSSVPDEVENTFKALLVLLGENENSFHNWTDILNRLRLSTHTHGDSVLDKMRKIQEQPMSQEKRKRVLQILTKYDGDKVRTVNSDAHSFFVWVENVAKAWGSS